MNTEETKRIFKFGWIVLVMLAIFLGAETLNVFKNLNNSPAYNSITVSGEGEAFAVPDLATFSFSVSADAKTVTAAQSNVTKKMDDILAALKDLGIEDKDIKTTDYSVYPKYRYEAVPAIYPPMPTRQVADGYTASHSVTVKVRKSEEAGKALSVAGDKGATNLSSISFTVDDPGKITDEARAAAIKEAKDKAKVLANELGVRLVRVVSFSDSNDGGIPMPYYQSLGSDAAVSQAKAPTLPTGENKVKVVVNIVYEIR